MSETDPAQRTRAVPAALAGTVLLGGEITINRLGFGAMRLPGAWGEPNLREATHILTRALELGVNFLDTAHAYGRSEEVISEALYPYPDGLIIATKAGYGRGRSGERIRDGRPKTIRRHAETSLELLRLERIDLLQLHTIDPGVPLEESIGTMLDLQREGKVRMIGVSNFGVQELGRARAVGEIASVQNRYSVGDRRSDDILDVCERDGIVFLPWFPLGAGGHARASELEAVGKAHDASAAQVALAWLLQRSPLMLPIPGTSKVTHLEENVGAAALRLSEQEFKQLEAMP